MDLKSVRRRCESALAAVQIPLPFTVEAFADVVSERRGRPLRLVPKGTALGPCGVWLALPNSDYVFYEPNTSAPHRDHIILHELGHLLCDHNAAEVVDDEVLRQLFPSLDARMVQRVLGRTTYTAVEEQEAELIASMVLERVNRPGAETTDSVEAESALGRLRATLGGRRATSHG
jgi:hypothetical protein